MSLVKQAVLLLLLAVASNTAPDGCEVLKLRMPAKEVDKIFGDWVLVWSIADFEIGNSLLYNISSSHIEFRLLPDNKTVTFTERNVYLENKTSCTTYFINMTRPAESDDPLMMRSDSIKVEKDGVVLPYNETGEVDFFESCPDCLSILYRSPSMTRFLLRYRKEGLHRDAEQLKAAQDEYKNQAECLGFKLERPFIYDGIADFCHRKSSPAAES
ncbi:saxitoxin and tetrodotoxin-binding protein 1-like [Embiotoca jacksoni]|uniref:saxitoxin and tetrodotoxin-binding protein 1-like n=1 Tax=Embiotoca jacksoni TaxID=100190 RepID=UPI003704ACA1